jgi:hypothetical protein
MKNRLFNLALLVSVLFFQCQSSSMQAAKDDGSFLLLKDEDLAAGPYHCRHHELFGKYTDGLNLAVLSGIDMVQAHAMNGGGYFVGKDSIPTESPIGYDLALWKQPLLKAPRTTSYCSGSSYAAFIEALNILWPNGTERLSADRLEALRMQEPDGGRREDMIKAWGWWNADGFGCHYCLVQYLAMGKEVKPNQLRPGDFINISWKSGLGHSVVFLGWAIKDNDKKMLYWSSQRATNGMADQLVSLQRIKEIKAVRLNDVTRLFTFDIKYPVASGIRGDAILWNWNLTPVPIE